MNIFVWEQYGNTLVYETESDEAICELLHRVMATVEDWGEGVVGEVEKLFQVLDTKPNAIRVDIHKFFNRHANHEAFEFGRFMTTIPLV